MTFNDLVRKCRDKNRGIAKGYATSIAKGYATSQSDYFEDLLSEGNTHTRMTEVLHDKYKNNETGRDVDMGNIHELSDYMAIRYSSCPNSMYGIGNEGCSASFTVSSTNGKRELMVESLNGKITITYFSGKNTTRIPEGWDWDNKVYPDMDRVEVVNSVSEAEDVIDRMMRAVEPAYFTR